MIIIQKLRWGNAFSYGDNNEIDFTTDIITQLIAANGSGKSSIAHILQEGLYNKNSKGLKKSDIPNRYISKGYWIKVDLLKDEDQYLVEVDRRTATLKMRLFKNGTDISSHTTTNSFKMLEEIIGLDFKTFSQLIYQSPDSSLQFLTATDTKRKEFFIEILQLEEYVRLFELFKATVAQHSSGAKTLEGSIAAVEKWIKQNTLEDLQEKELLPIEDVSLVEDERGYASLTSRVNTVNRTNTAIQANNKIKAQLMAIDLSKLEAIDATELLSYDTEQGQLGGLQSEKTRVSAYITKLQRVDGDHCPTCEQPVDGTFITNTITDNKSQLVCIGEQIEKISTTIARIRSNNERYKSKQDGFRQRKELSNSIDLSLPEELVNKFDIQEQLSDLAIRISNAKSRVAEITKKNTDIMKHNSRISIFLEQSAKMTADLTEYTAKLAASSSELATLELLKKTFSTNGIIAYKIENQVKDLETLTNDYLSKLSDGRFTIEFVVSGDKLDVHITDNGSVVDIIALSSGELARVNTSTLLAIRGLMSSISKSQINVLFLDEVISVLDDEGRDRLVEILLEETQLNTYLVSHSWTHPLLTKLEVIKTDNISRLEAR